MHAGDDLQGVGDWEHLQLKLLSLVDKARCTVACLAWGQQAGDEAPAGARAGPGQPGAAAAASSHGAPAPGQSAQALSQLEEIKRLVAAAASGAGLRGRVVTRRGGGGGVPHTQLPCPAAATALPAVARAAALAVREAGRGLGHL